MDEIYFAQSALRENKIYSRIFVRGSEAKPRAALGM